MAARLMHGLLSALHRGWQQGCDALHPAPRPTLLEALRDTYLAAAHTVTQVNPRHNFRYVCGWLSCPYRVIVTPQDDRRGLVHVGSLILPIDSLGGSPS